MNSERPDTATSTLLTGRGEYAPKFGNIVAGLSDLKFRSAVTPRMITSLYVLFIVAVLMFCVSLAVDRSEPGVKNIVGLVLIVPAIFLGAIVTARVVLEFVLTVFLLRDRVEEMRRSIESVPELVDQMSGLVDKIAVVAENMTEMTGKMGDLTSQMSSITETIDKLDEQLPTIVENTSDIPAQIGAMPFGQLKRGLKTLRNLTTGSDSDRDGSSENER